MSLSHSFKLFRNQSPVRCEGPGFELFSVVLYLLTSHKELLGTLTKSPPQLVLFVNKYSLTSTLRLLQHRALRDETMRYLEWGSPGRTSSKGGGVPLVLIFSF